MLSKVIGLMLSPRSTWQSIGKMSDAQFRPYLAYPAILGLIPALAWYYGSTRVGWTVGGSDPLFLADKSAIAIGVSFWITQILAIWIVGYFIHWMSETYGAHTSAVKGMALAGFTSTPILLGGIVGLYPNFAIDMLIAILVVSYSVYHLYIGIPIAMKMPPERGFLYASAMVGVSLVIVICVMCASLILWSLGLEPIFTDIPGG